MEDARKLREEAATCRELAREIKDPASVTMFLDRAAQLEERARTIERTQAADQKPSMRLVDAHKMRVKVG